MDSDRRLLEGATNKAERDEALAFLRERYRTAVAGTEWEDTYSRAMAKAKEDAGPSDWLELREIEGRGVARVWPRAGKGRAWVWTHGRWREAPGLVTKEGYALGRYQFKREFPDARMDELFQLIRGFLGEDDFNSRVDPTVDPRFERDQSLMEVGYQATLHHLRNGHQDFAAVLLAVQRELGCEYSRLRPYVARWYLDAAEHHGPFRSADRQPIVQSILSCLDAAVTEWASKDACLLVAEPEPEAKSSELDDFLWLMPKAVGRFADQTFQGIAKRVRFKLQRAPASGIFGHSAHKSQWHEFCYHAHYGPPELDWAFDQLVDPLIDDRVKQLDPANAVLMTLAGQWDEDDYQAQDGQTIWPNLLRSITREALRKLALDTDCDSSD